MSIISFNITRTRRTIFMPYLIHQFAEMEITQKEKRKILLRQVFYEALNFSL